VVDHQPGDERYDVYATMMKAVSGATQSVEIENAYFLTLPGMNELLHAALQRGVEVRIYTNSNKSVDEPLVSEPIMKSLPDLYKAGAKVFLKKGDTLHSKFMVVDDTFASVGSFNLHPRSLYYDSEMALNIIDETAATKLREQFDQDVTADKAIEVNSLKDLEIESTWYNRFIRKYFFRHL
jgi:cardiolipin synthase